ncbi:type VI secretion system protein TssA [Massilia sp. DWR3-1-1]|uniref:type VI secretion system protein TssA n=1 Tax=Massilia sp. DWR3-1-1 TaxID=2804559 RepID=UPI003CF7ECD3
MDIEELLAPVSAARPCGEDLAFSSELDAIGRARQADDPSLEQGAWVTTLKEADWKFVAAGCSRLLKSRSKDLRLAVWLAEASAKTASLRGLGEALLVTAGLCQRYWDALYPLADEGGHEQRIGNLSWIAARVAQLAREIPVTEGASAYCLNDFAFARSHAGSTAGAAPAGTSVPDPDGARRKSSAAFYRRLLEDCVYCQGALDELERVIDARLGPDGPGFTAARANLHDVAHFATPMAAVTAAPDAPPAAATAPDGAPALVASAPPPALAVAGGHVQSRAQALAQLRQVAAFFRQSEPHSPVAYLADKAAHWGEQPLHVWLRAVIKDDLLYAQLEEMLGAGKSAA